MRLYWQLVTYCMIFVVLIPGYVAGGFTANEYLHSTGGIAVTDSYFMQSGDNISKFGPHQNYQDQTAGEIALSGPQNSSYSHVETSGGTYMGSSSFTYNGQGIYKSGVGSDALVSNTSSPYCGMAVLPTDERRVATGLLMSNNGGRIETDMLADGMDVGFTQRFDAKNAVYDANSRNNVESGGTVNETNKSVFGTSPDKHKFATGDIVGRIDWQWGDTSDPFNLTSNESLFVK